MSEALLRKVREANARLSTIKARATFLDEEMTRTKERVAEIKTLASMDEKLTGVFHDLREDTLGSFLSALSATASSAVEDAFGEGYSVGFTSAGASGGYRITLHSPTGHEDSVAENQGDGITGIISLAMLLSVAHLSDRFPAGFLCMDEPLPGVDSRRGEFYSWLADVCRALDFQLIFTTHQLEASEAAEITISLGDLEDS